MKTLKYAAVAAALLFAMTVSAVAECNPAKIYVVGGGNWCAACKAVRIFLNERGVAFEYLNVVPNFYGNAGWNRLEQLFGVREVPVIATTRYFVVGSDEDQLKRFLCLRW